MWWLTMVSLVMMGAAEEEVHQQPPVSCEQAQLQCALREGCGSALKHYMIGCSAVLQGPEPTYCPEICQHSLIALTSTEEGKVLMKCECSDDFCESSKRRVEICRREVMLANRNETVVSCRIAQRICLADNVCSTALYFYNHNCRNMFLGKKCTRKCHNSVSILQRQDKAAKLKTCVCDGREDYDCPRIQRNMARLCFHTKLPSPAETPRVTTTTTTTESDIFERKEPASGAASVCGVATLLSALALVVFGGV